MPLRPITTIVRAYLQRRTLLARLRDAEAALSGARREHQRVLLNEMGDLHLELGDVHTALACYGSAIDASLDVGHLDSAATLCRRAVKRCPQVVRMHGTLGCLLLARGLLRDAERELSCYVEAARREGTAGFARERLAMLSRAFVDRESRLLLARLLRQVGDAVTAAEIEQSPDPDLTPERQRKLVATLLRRAVQPRLTGSNSIEPAPSWRPDLPHDDDLPFLDTTVLRTVPARRMPRWESAAAEPAPHPQAEPPVDPAAEASVRRPFPAPPPSLLDEELGRSWPFQASARPDPARPLDQLN